jgi:type I restriction enzyme R subunit
MYVDKKLAGIQAVQTLSRLNRAYKGPHGLKDTTYILDFANAPDEVLAAFQTYYETAQLAGVTDPELIFDLRAKLDSAGHYDDFEVDRVALVELNPKATQSQLVAAIEPVADRLLKRFKAAKAAHDEAVARYADGPEAKDAKDTLDALVLFKRDLGTFVRVYAFLSQMFDYGNTAIEKRAIFFKRLLPLLDFGRDREGVDLSKVVLTHHKLKQQGDAALVLGEAEGDYKLPPMTAPGSGQLQDKDKVRLSEIVAKVNDLFDGELTDHDMLAFVENIKGKMMESELLVQQAMNNTKDQFSNSPDFSAEQMNAIMDAFDAFSTMSKQAIDSDKVRLGLKHVLLGPAQLYEALRARGGLSA